VWLKINGLKRNFLSAASIYNAFNSNPLTMKNLLFLFGAFLMLLVSSCTDKIEETYTVNTPVYMAYDDLRSSFKVAEATTIIQRSPLPSPCLLRRCRPSGS
jgi:hypothetical protein